MGDAVELRTLRYFLAVAREENITNASRVLHVTQPTLSRQLKDLERELGVQLFVRGNRKTVLTDEGMLLRKRAEEIVSLADRAEAELAGVHGEVMGDVYIGGGETHAMGTVAQVIAELQQRHPDLRFHVHSGNADDVCERIDKGLLDFGLLIDPAPVSRYESVQLPLADRFGLLVREDSPLAEKGFVEPSDLRREPLVATRRGVMEALIAPWAGVDASDLDIRDSINLIYNGTLLVRCGAGSAVCLDGLVPAAAETGLRFLPFEPALTVHSHVVWKKYQVRSAAAEAFLDALRAKVEGPS